MKAKDLIKELSKYPDRDIEASVDIGTINTPFARAFGINLESTQEEPNGTITLLFTDGCLNDDNGG